MQSRIEALEAQVLELEEENRLLQAETRRALELEELFEISAELGGYEKTGANVIGLSPTNYYDLYLIDKGTNDGLELYMPVMAKGGLVGRISQVYDNYAEVTTLISEGSAIYGQINRPGGELVVVRGSAYEERSGSGPSLGWMEISFTSEQTDLAVGDEVEVYVISFDPEKKKISLGYRKPEDNPWTKFTDTYKEGDVANVKIVKFMTFGAFAEIIPGVDGLIHISQIANRRIGKPDEELTIGQQVDAKITAIDNEKQKVSLSIRALLEPARPARERVEREKDPEPEGDALVYEISADGQATGFAPEEDEATEE